MFRDVPGCSGMFRNVLCSWFYRRPFLTDFIHTYFFHLRVVLWQLFDTVNGKYQEPWLLQISKIEQKLQLIQTIWDVMALLTVVDFPLETTCSCKQDTKERYWGQQFWQMERHISVQPTEMTRPVTVDHLQSWFRIFRSDQTEMVRSIWWTSRNFRNFGLNGKRPWCQI